MGGQGLLLACCCFWKLTPCVEIGDNCGNCSAGTTPKYVTIDASALTECTGCVAGGPYGSFPPTWYAVDDIAISLGVFTLEQDAVDPCLYESEDVGTISFTLRGDDGGEIGCDHTPEFPTGGLTLEAKLERGASGWELRVWWNDVPSKAVVFWGSDSGVPACTVSPVVLTKPYECETFGTSFGAGVWGFHATEPGSVTIYPGRNDAGGTRCPGGAYIVGVNPGLGLHKDKVVAITEAGQAVCYLVEAATPAEIAAAAAAERIVRFSDAAMAAIEACGTSCADCCDDNCP